MLAQARPAAAELASLVRAIAMSSRTLTGAPSYTYTPPGSSVADPAYAGGAAEAPSHAMPEAKVVRPSKKAQWLRLTTRKGGSPLESQQSAQGAMLPPGCSMSEPHYSVKDPVYFADAK